MSHRRNVRSPCFTVIVNVIAISVSATLAVLAGCGGTSSAQPVVRADQAVAEAAFAPALQARLQQVLDRNKAVFAFPGAQAGVWTSDGAWVGVTGTATAAGKAAPARGDHTRIGSITKTFIAATVLRLVGEGKLALDDSLEKWLPGFPGGIFVG